MEARQVVEDPQEVEDLIGVPLNSITEADVTRASRLRCAHVYRVRAAARQWPGDGVAWLVRMNAAREVACENEWADQCGN